ncbi:MAG: zf-HC2 domain-containing protein [candidate division Zixibacteria bacterium]|nr:zf-HC2 domain-containing protein [candidate division Zixibacteria bacterium]
MSHCRDMIKKLADYLDGDLEPEFCTELEKHLKGCNNCKLMINSMKMTVQLCKDGTCEDLPQEFQDKFQQKLAERWKKKFDRQ